jgi:hypothetical protein
MDGEAFKAYLFNLEVAVAAAEGADPACAEAAYLDASFVAGDAFPLGSPESHALGVLLDAVGPMVTGATA